MRKIRLAEIALFIKEQYFDLFKINVFLKLCIVGSYPFSLEPLEI